MGWPRKLSKMENGLVTYMCAFTLLMGFKWLGIFSQIRECPRIGCTSLGTTVDSTTSSPGVLN